MYERLSEAALKTGERMEIGVVTAPDSAWKDRILPFLGHKGEPYASHIRRSFDGPLDELETRYYVGHRDGQVLTEVMIVGARGAGILGHVYTLPEHRRKGAYQAVMAAQIADMPRCGIRLLSLGTGFDSPPYRIYHSFGFEGIGPGRGEMLWRASPHAEAGLFQAGAVTARDARWDDWGYFGWLGLLSIGPDEEVPRSRIMRLKSRGIMEGPFVRLMLTCEQQAGMSVRVLHSESGATVGWAILAPDPQGLEDSWTLDLHAHPSFAHQLPALAADLPWPDAPVAALIAEPSGPKAVALEAAGFTRAARLPTWMKTDGGRRRDAALWVRQP
jgi:hypothetical protein